MSLSEVAQLYEYLVRIDQLLSGMTVKTETINKNIGASTSGGQSSLRSEMHLINMYLIAIEHWSGSGTLADTINRIQQSTAAAMRFYMVLMAINALLESNTPIGWIKLGGQIIGFAIATQNLVQ